MDDAHKEAFLLFFRGLARHAPGDDDITLEALHACELPESPVVYDMGAGTGSSTLVLAEALQTPVVAVDQIAQSLEETQTRAERRGIDAWVKTVEGDFMNLDMPEGSVDLIWSEGSAYAVGVKNALTYWKTLLKDHGYIAFSDCVWMTDERPDEAAEFWANEYPEMSTVDGLRGLAHELGFEVVTTIEMPRTAWVYYYGPLGQRVGLVSDDHPSEAKREVAAELRREIDVWEEHGHAYNYVFFVLRKR